MLKQDGSVRDQESVARYLPDLSNLDCPQLVLDLMDAHVPQSHYPVRKVALISIQGPAGFSGTLSEILLRTLGTNRSSISTTRVPWTFAINS
jgi:hypothetical protein